MRGRHDLSYYPHLVKIFHTLKWKTPFTRRKLDVVRSIEKKVITIPKKKRILGQGVFGTVYRLEECNTKGDCTDKHHSIKVIELKKGLTIHHVKKEMEKFLADKMIFWGVNGHAYTTFTYNDRKFGIIMMNNVVRGSELYESSTVDEYIKKYGVTKDLLRSLEYTISYFYQTAKVHGDLHGDNIMVIHDGRFVRRTRIIDYMTLMVNDQKTFRDGKSIINRIKESEKIIFGKKIKDGVIKVEKPHKQFKGVNSARNLKDIKTINRYYEAGTKGVPVIIRKNSDMMKKYLPKVYKYFVDLDKKKKSTEKLQAKKVKP